MPLKAPDDGVLFRDKHAGGCGRVGVAADDAQVVAGEGEDAGPVLGLRGRAQLGPASAVQVGTVTPARELADRFDLLGSGRGLQRISIHAVYARTSAAAVTALLSERDELRERLAWVEKAARDLVTAVDATVLPPQKRPLLPRPTDKPRAALTW